MKRSTTWAVLLFMQSCFVLPALAGDFDWLDNLNIDAKADAAGYRVSLSTRFHIGNMEVNAVIGDVDEPSEAYMIFRLSELSRQPVADVLNVYRANKNKGWGVMAKNLGIQPGSSEFHALKHGHDLARNTGSERGHSSGKGNGNNKGKKKS